MNLQARHDALVQQLQDSNLSDFQRSLIATEQKKLARDLYLISPGARIIRPDKKTIPEDQIQGIYVNKTFDSCSLSMAITELRSIRASRKGKKGL